MAKSDAADTAREEFFDSLAIIAKGGRVTYPMTGEGRKAYKAFFAIQALNKYEEAALDALAAVKAAKAALCDMCSISPGGEEEMTPGSAE